MKNTRLVTWFPAFLFCVIFFALVAYDAGYRINISPSVPVGIWKIAGPVTKDGYVVVTAGDHPGYRLAAERGYLIDRMPMLKRVVGTKGDIISYDVTERALTVNGRYIFMTEILSKDTEGRPLPAASFPVSLEAGEAWLSSENIRGYDSRYFGPVSEDILRGVTPLWIF